MRVGCGGILARWDCEHLKTRLSSQLLRWRNPSIAASPLCRERKPPADKNRPNEDPETIVVRLVPGHAGSGSLASNRLRAGTSFALSLIPGANSAAV